MTTALCLHCGELKFGALSECGACGKGPSGFLESVQFTDQFMHEQSLKELGAVIKAINKASPIPDIAPCVFALYLSRVFPDEDIPVNNPRLLDECEAILDQVDLPSFTMRSAEEIQIIPVLEYALKRAALVFGDPKNWVPGVCGVLLAGGTNSNDIRIAEKFNSELRERFAKNNISWLVEFEGEFSDPLEGFQYLIDLYNELFDKNIKGVG